LRRYGIGKSEFVANIQFLCPGFFEIDSVK